MDEVLVLFKWVKLGGSEWCNLYELFWYVIIGLFGLGKIIVLMNFGFDFLFVVQMGVGVICGVGGMCNCDWWFIDEVVLLDIVGCYIIQDSYVQVDKVVWLGFFDLFKIQCKCCFIDGVFIVISFFDLLLGSDVECVVYVQVICVCIQELYQQFGVCFLIYVMLIKFDLVLGFMEFFDSLNCEECVQVWGMIFVFDDGKSVEGLLVVFDSEFVLFEQCFIVCLVECLQQECDLVWCDLVYGFLQ